jgi:hypothetical protein
MVHGLSDTGVASLAISRSVPPGSALAVRCSVASPLRARYHGPNNFKEGVE